MASASVWGTANNWADDVDEAEKAGHLATPLPTQPAGPPANDFPSLGDAAKAPKGGKKKGKGVSMGLGQFMNMAQGKTPGAAAFRPSAPSHGASDKDILMSLPTQPRGKEAGDIDPMPQRGLGGGFKEYGGDRSGGFGDRERERPQRRGREGDDDFMPSKADTVDDWGATRTYVPGARSGGGGFRDGPPRREGSGFDRERPMREGPSADDVNDWGSMRKFEPNAGGPHRGGMGRDGPPRNAHGPADEVEDWGSMRKFEPSAGGPPRRDGPPRNGPGVATRADEVDEWGKGKAFQPSSGGPAQRGPHDESRGAADVQDRWGRKEAAPPSATDAGAPRERPRLNLAPKSQESSAPSSGSAQPKNNPFGAARPREEVLMEKGVDVVKAEMKLETGTVIRDESPEEAALKAEVQKLAEQLETLKASGPDPESIADEVASATAELDEKERELYKLSAELDAQVKYKKQDKERQPKGADKEDLANAGGDKWERSGPARTTREQRPKEHSGKEHEREADKPVKRGW